MSVSYLVIYWSDFGPSRRPLESHEHPNLVSARRQLRERGYRRTYGRASKGQVEEYVRAAGYEEKPAASVTQLASARRGISPSDDSLGASQSLSKMQ